MQITLAAYSRQQQCSGGIWLFLCTRNKSRSPGSLPGCLLLSLIISLISASHMFSTRWRHLRAEAVSLPAGEGRPWSKSEGPGRLSVDHRQTGATQSLGFFRHSTTEVNSFCGLFVFAATNCCSVAELLASEPKTTKKAETALAAPWTACRMDASWIRDESPMGSRVLRNDMSLFVAHTTPCVRDWDGHPVHVGALGSHERTLACRVC
jgi:hypothetical protein